MRSAGVTPSGMASDLDSLGSTEPDAGAPEPPADDAGGDTGGAGLPPLGGGDET